MNASAPQDPTGSTGAAVPPPQGRPASPGPDPDDLDQPDGTGHHDHADDAPTVTPTSPGPNPADVDETP